MSRVRPYRPRRHTPQAPLTVVLLLLGRLIRWLIGLLFKPRQRHEPRPVPCAPRSPAGAPPQWRSVPASAAPPPIATAPVQLPYRRRPHLLSKGERAFWHPLYLAVRGKYRIFCKVRLQDVVCAPRTRSDEGDWFRKIKGYHVDFVLCDPEMTAPLLVVELDDRSHRSPRAAECDRFKDAVLAAGGVPVYRVQAQQAYDPIELRETISRLLGRDG